MFLFSLFLSLISFLMSEFRISHACSVWGIIGHLLELAELNILFAAQGRVGDIIDQLFDIRSEYLGFISSNLAKVCLPDLGFFLSILQRSVIIYDVIGHIFCFSIIFVLFVSSLLLFYMFYHYFIYHFNSKSVDSTRIGERKST